MPNLTSAVFRNELRLQLRDYPFWAVAFLWQILLAFYLVDLTELGVAPGAVAWEIAAVGLPMLGAVAGLYLIYVMHREDSGKLGQLVDSLPHRSSAMVWGKLLAAMTLLGLLAAEIVVALIALELRAGTPLGAALPAAGSMLVWLLAPLVGAAGIGLAVGAVARRARLAYVTGVVLWLGLAIMGPTALVHLLGPVGFRWVEVFSPPMLVIQWSGLWGAFPLADLAWRQSLWIGGLGIALLGAAALFHKAGRDRGTRRVVPAAILILGVAMGAAAVGGEIVFHRRHLDAFLARAAGYEARGLLIPDRQPGTEAIRPEVRSYDLALKLGPGHALEARAAVEIANQHDRPLDVLAFTLAAELEVWDALVNGIPAAVDRQGDFLTVRPSGSLEPGATARVDFIYGGELWVWDIEPNRGYKLVAGIDDRGIWLPAGFGWYPAPGHQPAAEVARFGVGEYDVELYYNPLDYDPAEYRLTVTLAGPLELASSLGPVTPADGGPGATGGEPASAGSITGRVSGRSGVFLIGARDLGFAAGAAGPVVAAPAILEAALDVSAEAERALDFYRGLLPAEGPDELAVLATPEHVERWLGPSPGEGVLRPERTIGYAARTLVSPGWEATALRILLNSPRGSDLLDPWLGPGARFGGFGRETEQVSEAFRYFLKAVAMGELHDRTEYDRFLAMELEGSLTPPGEVDHYRDTIVALDAYYRANGLGAVRGVMSAVWEELRARQLDSAVVRELLGRAPALGGQGGAGDE